MIKNLNGNCIIFANTQKQADTICKHSYHSKNADSKKNLKLFKIVSVSSATVIFEHYEDWFGYYKNTVLNDELQGFVDLLDIIHDDDKLFNTLHKKINKKNLGSESIILLKKIPE